MSALAHAPIDQVSLVTLRLDPAAVPANHRFVMRAKHVERFVYITQGSVCFHLEDGVLCAGERDMVYLPCDTAYHSLWKTDSRFVVVDLLLRSGEGEDIRFGEKACVLFRDVHHVYDGLWRDLAQRAESDGPFDWLERLSLTFKMLYEIARDTNRSELDEKEARIQNGIKYLENHFAENFSIDHLARLCTLSASAFRADFLACKGMTPIDYRNRLRIRRATELLKSGSCTVAEAADRVGIHDANYFGKLFKRYAGTTPGVIKSSVFTAEEMPETTM